MNRRGYTLVELMASLIVFSVVMGALFVTFVSMWNNQAKSIGMPASQQGAEEIVYKLAGAFRAATNCLVTDSGCVTGTPVQNTTSSGATIYSRNSSGTLVQTTYGFASGTTNYQMTTGSTTTPLAADATVSITYYTSTTYNATALTSYTPSSTTTNDLIAVLITATVAQNGGNCTYSTFVRLRNGP